MSLFLVFRAICKALLLMLGGANVVHEGQKKIRKLLKLNFLRIVLGDPLGINPVIADSYSHVLRTRHLRVIYFLTFKSTSNCFIIFICCKGRH